MFKQIIKLKWLGMVLLLGIAGLSITLPPANSNSFKSEFLERINKVRQQGCKCGTVRMPPVGPLVWNDDLEDAAEGHARDMYKRNYFSHNSKDGRNIQDRIMGAGYTYDGYKSFAIGENIAMGQESIAEVSNGWFKSPSHCKNLMNADFKEVGVAEHNKYWVQDFGGREAFTAREKDLIKKGKLIIRRRNAE